MAYSSFSEQGWAVRDSAQRTHQLRGLFTSRYGKPNRTYLVGHSLGALIATNLVERQPQHYDGVLPVCGILSGGQTTTDYMPLFHKDRYAGAVAAHGATSLLVRQTVPTFGHCNVPTAVTLAAFATLVNMVEN